MASEVRVAGVILLDSFGRMKSKEHDFFRQHQDNSA